MSAPGTNWQIMLADLSIVLFLTTFSALANDPRRAHPGSHAGPHRPSAERGLEIAEPVALWSAGKGAPPLADWLRSQAFDSRMRVNVLGSYQAGDRVHVLADATAVADNPALAGRPVRLILEPAARSAVTVTLTYDNG